MKKKKKEEKDISLEKELKANWMYKFSQLVAFNLATIRKYYGESYYLSLNDIIRISQDVYILNEKEKEELLKSIKSYLGKNFSVDVISKEEEKLEFLIKENE